jgi:hypothetical protein
MEPQKLVAPIDEKCGIMNAQTPRVPLRCTCGKCAMPFGYLTLSPSGYVIIIESHHHGETHQNVIPLTAVPLALGNSAIVIQAGGDGGTHQHIIPLA